jgi:hypothetical protein
MYALVENGALPPVTLMLHSRCQFHETILAEIYG